MQTAPSHELYGSRPWLRKERSAAMIACTPLARLGWTRFLLLLVLLLPCDSTAQHPDDGIVLEPHPRPPSATLVVSCDAECTWTLDGKPKGTIEAEGSASVVVQPGRHVIAAGSADGPEHQQKEVQLNEGHPAAVHFQLQPQRQVRMREEQQRRVDDILRQGDYQRGHQEYGEAGRLYGQACEGGSAEACAKLAVLYQDGKGVEQDWERSHQLKARACQGGQLASCVELGNDYDLANHIGRDYAQAASLYQRACDGANMDGCFSLGRLYFSGHGVVHDDARGRQLFAQACTGQNPWACYWLGYYAEFAEGVPQDYLRARQFYRHACQLDNLTACYREGFLAERGRGGPRDDAGARQSYQTACERGFPQACYSLGQLNESGRGGPRDTALAGQLYRKACSGGVTAACEAARNLP